MKKVVLQVPDSKMGFFMELIRHLGFEVSEESEVSEEQIEIVRERIKSGQSVDMLPWKEVYPQFTYKGKS